MVLTPRGLRFRGRLIPCSIGKGGIVTDKREGDGATPRGIHRIIGATYRADRMVHPLGGKGGQIPLRALRHGDIWSDDPKDPAYNHGFHAPGHPFSHERLWRADRLYDLILFTDWNWPDARPGHGSAIFLHRWRKPGHPTEGCIAFAPRDLIWITRHITAGTRLIVR